MKMDFDALDWAHITAGIICTGYYFLYPPMRWFVLFPMLAMWLFIGGGIGRHYIDRYHSDFSNGPDGGGFVALAGAIPSCLYIMSKMGVYLWIGLAILISCGGYMYYLLHSLASKVKEE